MSDLLVCPCGAFPVLETQLCYSDPLTYKAEVRCPSCKRSAWSGGSKCAEDAVEDVQRLWRNLHPKGSQP